MWNILIANGQTLEGDTLFMFNYRSDRMRELTGVLGLPDRPMEVNIPGNLVRLSTGGSVTRADFPPGYYYHVQVQSRLDIPRCFPASQHGQRPR